MITLSFVSTFYVILRYLAQHRVKYSETLGMTALPSLSTAR